MLGLENLLKVLLLLLVLLLIAWLWWNWPLNLHWPDGSSRKTPELPPIQVDRRDAKDAAQIIGDRVVEKQYLKFWLQDPKKAAPNAILASASQPGTISIGSDRRPCQANQEVSFEIAQKGTYRLEWSPAVTDGSLNGEFADIEFLDDKVIVKVITAPQTPNSQDEQPSSQDKRTSSQDKRTSSQVDQTSSQDKRTSPTVERSTPPIPGVPLGPGQSTRRPVLEPRRMRIEQNSTSTPGTRKIDLFIRLEGDEFNADAERDQLLKQVVWTDDQGVLKWQGPTLRLTVIRPRMHIIAKLTTAGRTIQDEVDVVLPPTRPELQRP